MLIRYNTDYKKNTSKTDDSEQITEITKILPRMTCLFDPLGFIEPSIIRAKLILIHLFDYSSFFFYIYFLFLIVL